MKVKRFKAGLRESLKPMRLVGSMAVGAVTGGLIGDRFKKGPENRTANIGSMIGAGTGAIGAIGVGYRKGVKDWDYNNDPEIIRQREEEGRRELQETIEGYLLDCKGYQDAQREIKSSKDCERKYNFKFKPDWYKFLQISANFFRKNATTWYKTIESCNEPYNFEWYLTIEDSDCNLPEVVPTPGYVGMEEEDGVLSTECLLSFGTNPDYFVNFLPRENKYVWHSKKYDNLSDILKENDLVRDFKYRNNNGNKEPYKDNPDIFNVHLKIVEEYARLLKQIR